MHDPREFISSRHTLVRVGFCLDYSVKNSFAAVSICETPTHEINLSSSNLVAIFLVLACVL